MFKKSKFVNINTLNLTSLGKVAKLKPVYIFIL